MDSSNEILPEVVLSDYDEVMLSDEERPVEDVVRPKKEETPITAATTTPSTSISSPTNITDPSPSVAGTSDNRTDNVKNSTRSANTATSQRFQCHLCNGNHFLFRCATFRKMSPEKRLRTVVSRHYCSTCLRADHQSKSCPFVFRCQHCKARHHTLLHIDQRSNKRATTSSSSTQPEVRSQQVAPSVTQTSNREKTLYGPVTPSSCVNYMSRLPISRTISLAPTLIIRLCLDNSSIPIRALLDPCCRVSQICESLVEQLRWPVMQFGDSPFCDLAIMSSYDESKMLFITAKVAKLTSGITPFVSIPHTIRESFAGLELADPTFYRSGAIALVLGPEVYARIIAPRVITQPGLPTAQYTSFGWVISGPVSL